MEIFESLVPLGIVILCLAGAAALAGMAYLFFSLTKSLKGTMAKVDPLLDDAKELTEKSKGIVDKIDPIMDRATLTIDAANLEIMRVDQILEDVNTVTGNVAKVSGSLDALTVVPVDLISSVTGKIRTMIHPHVDSEDTGVKASAFNAVDSGLSSVDDKMADLQVEKEARRAEHEEEVARRAASHGLSNETAHTIKNAVSVQVNADTESLS